MNRDFVEMLSALSEAGVEYLVVGAHAMAAHGVPRATDDLDAHGGAGDVSQSASPLRVARPGIVTAATWLS